LALVGLSAAVRKAIPKAPTIPYALLAIGLTVLFELVWFACLLVPVYLAVVLDRRLPGTPRKDRQLEPLFSFSLASLDAYPLLLAAGAALSIAKELWFYH
jgi:hypothetical protein